MSSEAKGRAAAEPGALESCRSSLPHHCHQLCLCTSPQALLRGGGGCLTIRPTPTAQALTQPRRFLLTQGHHLHDPLSEQFLKFCALCTLRPSPQALP